MYFSSSLQYCFYDAFPEIAFLHNIDFFQHRPVCFFFFLHYSFHEFFAPNFWQCQSAIYFYFYLFFIYVLFIHLIFKFLLIRSGDLFFSILFTPFLQYLLAHLHPPLEGLHALNCSFVYNIKRPFIFKKNLFLSSLLFPEIVLSKENIR